jgi:hypothetical protein
MKNIATVISVKQTINEKLSQTFTKKAGIHKYSIKKLASVEKLR